ncbi:MAG: hypothetical protein JWN70_3192 [Planctomycetaceae bacterium]|nr:hypothetical protein [Planctomycetaceae bacterium]
MADAPATPPLESNPPQRVLDVFYIRAGWQTAVSKAIEDNLPAVASLLRDHRFYVLNEDQTHDYLKLRYGMVSAVPIMVVLDRAAAKRNLQTGFGFRLCFGVVRNPETAVALLKWGVQMALMSRAELMTKAVRESGHRQTFEGLIDLIGEGTANLVEFGAV